MVPWGLGLGKRRELFRPCRASERCPAPYFLSERASTKNASGGPKPAAFGLKKTAYLHFLAVESQVICAFSQADLLVGALSAAKAGAAKATARPRVMMETSVFIGGFSLHGRYLVVGRDKTIRVGCASAWDKLTGNLRHCVLRLLRAKDLQAGCSALPRYLRHASRRALAVSGLDVVDGSRHRPPSGPVPSPL
jgi:hypothetical protein